MAAAVVDYLEGARGDPGAALLGGGHRRAAAYYADSLEGPGRWLGAGAAFQRLDGAVERDAFQRVLEGRHPLTGARLVTARGSSQRQPSGGRHRGPVRRRRPGAVHGRPTPPGCSGCATRDVEELIDAGTAGRRRPGRSGLARDRRRRRRAVVPDREITRHLELAAHAGDRGRRARRRRRRRPAVGRPGRPAAAGDPAVRAPPVRRPPRCADGERAASVGRRCRCRPRRRRTGGAVSDPARRRSPRSPPRRKPPVARVGFDVTLTCEKSLGLLTMLSRRRTAAALRAGAATSPTTPPSPTSIGWRRSPAAAARRSTPKAWSSPPTSTARRGRSTRIRISTTWSPTPSSTTTATSAPSTPGRCTGTPRRRPRWPPRRPAGSCATSGWAGGDATTACGRSPGSTSGRSASSPAVATRWTRSKRCSKNGSAGRSATTRRTPWRCRPARPSRRVDPAALVAEWRQRADDGRLRRRRLLRPLRRSGDRLTTGCPTELVDRLFADLAASRPSGCARTTTTFDRGDVMATIADWSITDGHGPPQGAAAAGRGRAARRPVLRQRRWSCELAGDAAGRGDPPPRRHDGQRRPGRTGVHHRRAPRGRSRDRRPVHDGRPRRDRRRSSTPSSSTPRWPRSTG